MQALVMQHPRSPEQVGTGEGRVSGLAHDSTVGTVSTGPVAPAGQLSCSSSALILNQIVFNLYLVQSNALRSLVATPRHSQHASVPAVCACNFVSWCRSRAMGEPFRVERKDLDFERRFEEVRTRLDKAYNCVLYAAEKGQVDVICRSSGELLVTKQTAAHRGKLVALSWPRYDQHAPNNCKPAG